MTVVDTVTGEILAVTTEAAERFADRIRLDLEGAADRIEAAKSKIRTAITERHDLALGYRSPGEYLADRFADALSRLGVDARREFVAELSSAGLSTRAIAPVVGTSFKTVARDLESGVSRDTPEPGGVDDPADMSEDDFMDVVADLDEGTFEAALSDARDAGDLSRTGVASHLPPPPRAVTGIDGKTYTRPATHHRRAEPAPQPSIEDDLAEFPSLTHYAENGRRDDVPAMASDLRRYRERGELDERLDILHRSIALDQSKRDGTYRPAETVRALDPHCPTCTCTQE